MEYQDTDTVKHIGILACTAEGAALCYRTICREAEDFLDRHLHPEITIHTFSLRSYLDLIDRDNWTGVAALMSQSAAKLTQAGADLIICPNNTLHRAFDQVVSSIPWLHIADIVAAETARRGFRLVGLLGTRIVMKGSFYSQKLGLRGIDSVIPDENGRSRIAQIILTELIAGQYTDHRSGMYLQGVISQMKTRGCDAVILSSTELPLLVSEEQSVLPLLDSTRLLAQAALKHAASSRWNRVAQDQPVAYHVSHMS